VNLLDLVVVLVTISAAATGYRLGFLTRVLSWTGGIFGLGVGIWVVRRVLPVVGGEAFIRLVIILVVVLVLAGIGASIGDAIGRRFRRGLTRDVIGVDRAGGAAAGVAGILLFVWLLSPVLAALPGVFASQTRRSVIIGWLEAAAPRPPGAIQALSGLVAGTRFPQVFTDMQEAPDTGPPPAAGGLSTERLAAVIASSVNIETRGCGGRYEGSGFTAAPDTVVTNAHVVAGAQEIRVRRPDGVVRAARVVVFDEDRDLAVLSVPDLGQAPLPIGEAQVGAEGVVVGYPGGQNRPRVAPARIRSESPTVGYDIYDEDRVRRQVLYLAADLAPGDSGAALVSSDGAVVGVAFAIAPDRRTTAFAVDDSELRAVLAAPRLPTTGRCL